MDSHTFNYQEAFGSFLRHTKQKKILANVFHNFLNALGKETLLGRKDGQVNKALTVLDLGCGEGDIIINFIQNTLPTEEDFADKISLTSDFPLPLSFVINYFGVDLDTTYIEAVRRSLSTDVRVSDMEIVSANVFQKDFLKTFTSPPRAIKIIIGSHLLYSAKGESNIHAFVENITKALDMNGLALLIHETQNSDIITIGRQFGYPDIYNCTEYVTKSCFSLQPQVDLITIPVPSQLHFQSMSGTLWQHMKDIFRHSPLENIPSFKENKRLLEFIVKRNLHSLADEGLLAHYVEVVQDTINRNGGFLTIRSELQILLSPEHTPDFKTAAKHAAQYTMAHLDTTQEQTIVYEVRGK